MASEMTNASSVVCGSASAGVNDAQLALCLLQGAAFACCHPLDVRSAALISTASCGGLVQVSIHWICWDHPENVPPVFDFCKHKHLLNVMGTSWSSRAKYLFLCGSTVVFPDSPFFEFWYRILKHDHNVVRVPAITRENRGEPMFQAARDLIANQTRAKRWAPKDAGPHSVRSTSWAQAEAWLGAAAYQFWPGCISKQSNALTAGPCRCPILCY